MNHLSLRWRQATASDVALLAQFNKQLIEDEQHRNRMTVAELEARMRGWLAGEYDAIMFEQHDVPVAYALFRTEPDDIYLRQFFVARQHRRQGIGRTALHLLHTAIWTAPSRITVEVLAANRQAHAFWKSVGFADYAVTLERMLPAT